MYSRGFLPLFTELQLLIPETFYDVPSDENIDAEQTKASAYAG